MGGAITLVALGVSDRDTGFELERSFDARFLGDEERARIFCYSQGGFDNSYFVGIEDGDAAGKELGFLGLPGGRNLLRTRR